MTSHNVLRYAELLVRENKVGQAKEYLRKQREECDFFIHGYTNGEKKYKMPGRGFIWKINEIIFETCDYTGTFTGIMN